MAKIPGLTVAVTGASGYIAGRLIELLEEDSKVERILGFDVREPGPLRTSKLIFDHVDVRNPALEARFKGVDVVVHLAFIMDPIRDEAEMRDVNVNGTQNVLKCVGRAGVPRAIYTSSGVAYGAHPDNDMPLTEESPLRANLDFSYAAHKLEAEYVVKEFRDEFPDRKVAVFRPAIVFGEHCDNAWSHQLELPVLFSIQGHEPPFQFVHEEDVASALAFAVVNELDGAYNLCPRDWLEYDELVSVLGKRRVSLPEPAAFAMADRLWSLNMGEAPPGYLHYVMYPWVMSPEKLEGAGFKCEHSSYDALIATLKHTGTRVRLGRVRVRKSNLAKGGIAGAGLIAAGFVARGLRHRRA
ncbi:MAG: NAD-dependent epimerase/dehydratase family protein [Actinomycetota bacterium]